MTTTIEQTTTVVSRRLSRDLVVALVLGAATFLVYLPSLSAGFVDYDDPQYVTGNPVVQRGLTGEGFVWAFTTTRFSNWLPVTWLSHMLDCELYGLNPRGHHATSALLHAFNAAALFVALRMLTGRRWAPLVAAAVFAVHPLRVESVTWIAERKDVLCGTFFMLALVAYAAYCRRPSWWRLGLVALCHALGLMSKTMLVTLPCLLLLLDFWPLRRVRVAGVEAGDENAPGSEAAEFPNQTIARVLLEKLPLFALSVISCVWTVVLQSEGGAMWGTRHLTFGERGANAFVSVVRYLGTIAWPVDLSVFYPHPGRWPAWLAIGAVAIVLGISAWAVTQFRRRPFVAVGWFWFVGMLFPVSGIVQVGLQSMADRYTYLPAIGLLVAAVWAAAELVERRPNFRPLAGIATVILVGALSIGTWNQQRHWANTFTLFEHALAVDEDNWLAHNMVGVIYAANGERMIEGGNIPQGLAHHEQAAAHLERSLRGNPGHYLSWHNYGWSSYRLGKLDQSVDAYRRAIRANGDFGPSHLYLAVSLAHLNRWDEANPCFEEAVRRQRRPAGVYVEWGEALVRHGRREEAVARFNEALRADPNHDPARRALAQLTAPLTTPLAGEAIGPVK